MNVPTPLPKDERYRRIIELAGTDAIVLNASIDKRGIHPQFAGQRGMIRNNELSFSEPIDYAQWVEPCDHCGAIPCRC